ncbi:AN1-type zinc finger protein 1 [Clupea harengus]|uniref:AN1-type zinc finger protein 1 n=1 Tax=Clupea harengus TaxID=7950 RepID=A0A6P8GQU2_CLUHA|nr:AN1-type zinc finger protein 1 [Clupea harengus]
MAELDIGKHCKIKDCNRQDFLPFTCDACSGVFCLEHRSRESHSCPQEQEQVQREPIVSGVCTSHPCTFQECKGKELLPVICRCCEKHFCLAHRHPDDHKCEKLETPKPRMAATKELVQKIVESKKSTPLSGRRKGAKNSATAAKVALMKLKMCACGDKAIPQVERAYFNVFLPKESKDCSLPLFFCTKWTLGKVIDSVASQAGLKNNNNILTAKKLRLCHPETGEVMKMDVPLLSLLDHPELPLHNGGNIILEYLDNGDTGLDDVRAYIAVP